MCVTSQAKARPREAQVCWADRALDQRLQGDPERQAVKGDNPSTGAIEQLCIAQENARRPPLFKHDSRRAKARGIRRNIAIDLSTQTRGGPLGHNKWLTAQGKQPYDARHQQQRQQSKAKQAHCRAPPHTAPLFRRRGSLGAVWRWAVRLCGHSPLSGQFMAGRAPAVLSHRFGRLGRNRYTVHAGFDVARMRLR